MARATRRAEPARPAGGGSKLPRVRRQVAGRGQAETAERIQGRARAAGDRPGADDTNERRHAMSGVIGQAVSRIDGPVKVTGSAHYSGEIALPDLAYAEIVGAGIASGRITSIDTAQAERADGVAGILTHRNLPKVNQVPLVPSLMGGPAPGETFFPMQDDLVHYAGQPVAIVIADSLERAQHAATLVQ